MLRVFGGHLGLFDDRCMPGGSGGGRSPPAFWGFYQGEAHGSQRALGVLARILTNPVIKSLDSFIPAFAGLTELFWCFLVSKGNVIWDSFGPDSRGPVGTRLLMLLFHFARRVGWVRKITLPTSGLFIPSPMIALFLQFLSATVHNLVSADLAIGKNILALLEASEAHASIRTQKTIHQGKLCEV